ncbi:hypothetical protein KC336_g13397 [Hortaea werneckii]|nr:hypothetical protein KC329_g15450 [Hortaea werneckii]KAI7407197.1 hypothetical protein KC336_g13397 [Hortaea werneckii]
MVSSGDVASYPDVYRPSKRRSSDRSGSSAKGHRRRGSLTRFCWEYARLGVCKFYSRHGRCEFAHELPDRNYFQKHFPDHLTYPPQWYCREQIAKKAHACSSPSEPRRFAELESASSSGIDCASGPCHPPTSGPKPGAVREGRINGEASTRLGSDTPTLPPPRSPQGPQGNIQNLASGGSLNDVELESPPVDSPISSEVANDTPDPAPSRQLRKRKPKTTSVFCKRAADPGDPFGQMSKRVQRKRLSAVRTLEQAWSEKQDEWLPKLLWAVEIRVDGDPDQLKSALDWHTGLLVKLGEMAELTSGDPASAHLYLREASQHHAISWDEEPTAVGISVHRLWEILKRALRLAVREQASKSSATSPHPEQERTVRTRRTIGYLRCDGLECSDVDNEEPPMPPQQGLKREPSEESPESIVVTGTRPNKRLRADSQPGAQPEVQPEIQPEIQPEVQPEVQPEAQPELPTNALDRYRLELEEAKRAAELAFARFDMLEKKDRVQRLELQLSS